MIGVFGIFHPYFIRSKEENKKCRHANIPYINNEEKLAFFLSSPRRFCIFYTFLMAFLRKTHCDNVIS